MRRLHERRIMSQPIVLQRGKSEEVHVTLSGDSRMSSRDALTGCWLLQLLAGFWLSNKSSSSGPMLVSTSLTSSHNIVALNCDCSKLRPSGS
jgi:hypothetical protein